MVYEDEKVVWRIVETNEINDKPTIKLDRYSIRDKFLDIEYIKEIKELKEDYPKELCGLSLLSFMECISYFIYRDEPAEEYTNVFDICVISYNGNNNIVYEMQ